MDTTIGIEPTVDFAFKRVLGNPAYADVTIHFLNSVLGVEPRITQVDFTNPFLDKETAEDKLAVLDVLATDEHGRVFDIEMQTTLAAELPQRLTYYVSTLYSMRLFEGDDYGKLRPAICICVMNDVLFPSAPSLHTDFRLRSLLGVELTDHLQIHTLELPKYRRPENNREVESPLEKWAYFFNYAATSTPDELSKRLKDKEFARATGVLEMISKDLEERLLYEFRLKRVRDEQSRARIEAARLEEARERALKEGRETGMQEGREAGMQEGREAGMQEGREAGMQEGRFAGRLEGRLEGALIGKVQLLQQLNGERVASTEELSALPSEELQRLIDQGQEQLRGRQ
jgi:predicted transposase/invertase (TIGR01784 family)